MTSQSIYKILRSVTLGHAVADALGVPVEFLRREELAADPVTGMRGYGTHPVPAGAWSDDTSMAVAALDVLGREAWSFGDVMAAFGAWLFCAEYTPTGVMFDVGGTCATAIRNYCKNGMSAENCGLCDDYANGNGSLMRIYPFSLLAYAKGLLTGDALALIDLASALTHAHERSCLGCRIYHRILVRLLNGEGKEGVLTALREAAEAERGSAEYSHYHRLFSGDIASLPEDAIHSTGYVVDTLEAAVYCLLTTDSYAACALRAVNLGEDTDTVGAVAGSLAGALYGEEGIPKEWLATLLKRDDLDAWCKKAAEMWCK